MSEGRIAFVFSLGLVALMVLLELGILASNDNQSSPGPSASATPTGAAGAQEQGCPADLDLPDGVDDRVCLSVDDNDLTALQPTEGPSGGKSLMGFRSPSGAIACTDVRGRTVACAVKGWTFEARDAERGNTVVIWSGRSDLPDADVKPAAIAVDDPATFAVPRLQFGQVVRMNADWFCDVQEVGVACWSPKARSGLLVSRNQWMTWSPAGVEGSP